MKDQKNNWNWWNFLLWVLIGTFILMVISPLLPSPQKTEEISFSQFLNSLDKGDIKSVRISGEDIFGKLSNKKEFKTRAINYPNLVTNLREKNVDIKVEPPMENNWVVGLFAQILLPLLFFAFLCIKIVPSVKISIFM